MLWLWMWRALKRLAGWFVVAPVFLTMTAVYMLVPPKLFERVPLDWLTRLCCWADIHDDRCTDSAQGAHGDWLYTYTCKECGRVRQWRTYPSCY